MAIFALRKSPTMVQRLSVISVVSLVVLASIGAVVVGTHSLGASGVTANVPQPPLLSAGSAQGDAGGVSTGGRAAYNSTEQTTVTVTMSNSTAVATSATSQNSTSSAGGSLLVTNSTGISTSSGDDGESGWLVGGDD